MCVYVCEWVCVFVCEWVCVFVCVRETQAHKQSDSRAMEGTVSYLLLPP